MNRGVGKGRKPRHRSFGNLSVASRHDVWCKEDERSEMGSQDGLQAQASCGCIATCLSQKELDNRKVNLGKGDVLDTSRAHARQ
jgi:hypothetical protein